LATVDDLFFCQQVFYILSTSVIPDFSLIRDNLYYTND